jgi:ParB family chromosome partitioning protein
VVAEAVGIKRSRLFQLLGTEKLPEAAREDIRAGRLSEKQSRALQGLPPAQQEALRVAIVEEELPAEEAMRRARAMRGGPRADGAAPVVALPERRRTEERATGPARSADDPTATLLAAIAAAAGGGRAERSDLARAADAAAAPGYDAARLRSEVLALARSLARAPVAALRPGGETYPVLVALWGALDAILGAER